MPPTPEGEARKKQIGFLRPLVIEAGCQEPKADRCAEFVRQAVEECAEVYETDPTIPDKRGVLRRLHKLRQAYAGLFDDRVGEMALALIPGWTGVSAKSAIAELNIAISNAGRVMQRRRGIPEGSIDRPGLDWFVKRLLLAEKVGGFEWTAYRNRDNNIMAKGSLITAIRAIEREWPLPQGFVPESDSTLLKSVERARSTFA